MVGEAMVDGWSAYLCVPLAGSTRSPVRAGAGSLALR